VDVGENFDGVTALHLAARHGTIDVMSVLLERGADLQFKDANGDTALRHAVCHGSIAKAAWLVDQGLDVNELSADGSTLLFDAANMGQLHMMKWLKRRGTTLTAVNEQGRSALYAVRSGALSCMKWLVSQGLPVETVDNDGTTLLHYAAHEGSVERIDWLVAKGVNVAAVHETQGYTALFHAGLQGHVHAMGCLISHGADVNALDTEGRTVMHAAIANGHAAAANFLLRRIRDGVTLSAFNGAKHSPAPGMEGYAVLLDGIHHKWTQLHTLDEKYSCVEHPVSVECVRADLEWLAPVLALLPSDAKVLRVGAMLRERQELASETAMAMLLEEEEEEGEEEERKKEGGGEGKEDGERGRKKRRKARKANAKARRDMEEYANDEEGGGEGIESENAVPVEEAKDEEAKDKEAKDEEAKGEEAKDFTSKAKEQHRKEQQEEKQQQQQQQQHQQQLDLAAKPALQYSWVQQDVEAMERLLDQVERLAVENERLDVLNTALHEQGARDKARFAQVLASRILECNGAVEELRESLDTANDSLDTANAEIGRLCTFNDGLVEELASLKQDLGAANEEVEGTLAKFELLEQMYQPVQTENEQRKEMLADTRRAAVEISRSRLDLNLPTKRMGELDCVALAKLGLTVEAMSLLQGVVCDPSFHPWRVKQRAGSTAGEVEEVVDWTDQQLADVVRTYSKRCSEAGGKAVGVAVAQEVLRCSKEVQGWNASGGYCVTIPYHYGAKRELRPDELLKIAAGIDVPGSRAGGNRAALGRLAVVPQQQRSRRPIRNTPAAASISCMSWSRRAAASTSGRHGRR
jgi:ankyrin repeat protein